MSGEEGYRREPLGGPRVRTDVVDVYVFRRCAGAGGSGEAEFLQLLRAGEPLAKTWQPIMGHIEPGETAVRTAVRELREEAGLAAEGPDVLGLWALEQVHPFYLAVLDCIVMSPRFACEVRAGWAPVLNAEHTAARWTREAGDFMWPGQKRAAEEILSEIIRGTTASRAQVVVRGESAG